MPSSRSKAAVAAQSGQAWRDFHASPAGRLALAELFAWAGVYARVESADPIEVARLTGERNTALRIIELMGLKSGDVTRQAQNDADLLERFISNGRSAHD